MLFVGLGAYGAGSTALVAGTTLTSDPGDVIDRSPSIFSAFQQ